MDICSLRNRKTQVSVSRAYRDDSEVKSHVAALAEEQAHFPELI